MKRIKLFLLIVFSVLLVACEDENNVEKKDDYSNVEDVVDDSDKTGDPTDETYEKDGDIVKYFKTFGVEELVNDGSDWNDKNCFIIEETFSDGMTINMKYYDIEDSVYITLDFVATFADKTLITQVDYYLGFDTSVKYYGSGDLLDGFLTYNGFDQTPMFELNENYAYELQGDSTKADMQTMLNTMIVNLNAYFNEEVGGTFIDSSN